MTVTKEDYLIREIERFNAMCKQYANLHPGTTIDCEDALKRAPSHAPGLMLFAASIIDMIRRGSTPKGDAALDRQVGGDHYKDMAIQPVEYIHRNGIGFCEGAIIKYVSRWRKKNGVEDLKKARHFLDLLIEMETKKKKTLDGDLSIC